jgi:hypothetical protein
LSNVYLNRFKVKEREKEMEKRMASDKQRKGIGKKYHKEGRRYLFFAEKLTWALNITTIA